jgi:hypothetical protein
MDVAEPSFDHSTFSRNRARLLEHDVAHEFFTRVVAQARSLQLLSDEHFTVDGTLVEAWASLKSFKPRHQGPAQHPATPVIRRLTSTASAAATRLINQPPTPKRGCARKGLKPKALFNPPRGTPSLIKQRSQEGPAVCAVDSCQPHGIGRDHFRGLKAVIIGKLVRDCRRSVHLRLPTQIVPARSETGLDVRDIATR